MTTPKAPGPFAARLRTLRGQAGLSVAALAEAAGLHRTHVYQLEAGDRAPSWETVTKLAAALGTTPDAFLPYAE